MFFGPSIWFPFHPFPCTHTFFLFRILFSCLLRLHVLSSHFLPSSARTSAHSYIQPRFQVAQVLIRRSGSPVVPVHLVFRSLPPHTHLYCLVSFSCLRLFPFLRAHALQSVPQFLTLHAGRACETLGVTHDCSVNFHCMRQ